MKKLKFLTLIRVLCSFVLIALLPPCSKDDGQSNDVDNPNELTEFTPSTELVSYLVDGIDFASNTSSIEVSFTSNKSWSVKSGASWCILSPSSGKKGANKFLITLEKNQSSEERETIITLQVAEVANYIKVRQNGNANFDITMKNAGTLSSFLGDRYLDITRLKVNGPLNGTDFDLITNMGRNGRLSILDLSEATIVEGGSYNSYIGEYIKTQDNEITDYMFWWYENLTELYLPHKVTKIGQCAIYSCSKLRIIKLPENLKSIDLFGISVLYALEDLELPDGLEALGSHALTNLSSLKSLTLPSTVKYLDLGVFSGTERLQSLHCESVEPPVCNMTFSLLGTSSTLIKNGTKLYVPKGSLSKYKNDKEWGLFKTIIEE
ncbi:MAG: leucine-rich repeat protein [Bacteroidaceae bacterium]|nr:leucine-rich repeat protein [Bacteroidaceae bacterium]